MRSSFRTPVLPLKFPFSLEHRDTILSIGSCFAVHLGKKLQKGKFNVRLNPFGIIYNPLSIAYALERILHGKLYQLEDLFEYRNLYHSFDHHSIFSLPNPEEALQQINRQLTSAKKQLSACNRLLITFGTAHVFWYLEQARVVANCHKLPGQLFERRRLSVEAITKRLGPLFTRLRSQYHELEIVLTVSPVRHLRDGFIENQRSKAILLLAAEQLEKNFPFIHYYPAYEILQDDLRDYRFYANDMIHPNDLAIEYIWTHFKDSFFTASTKDILSTLKKLNKAIDHKPFHPEGEAHQKFLHQQLTNIEQLKSDYPYIDFSGEQNKLTEQVVK